MLSYKNLFKKYLEYAYQNLVLKNKIAILEKELKELKEYVDLDYWEEDLLK